MGSVISKVNVNNTEYLTSPCLLFTASLSDLDTTTNTFGLRPASTSTLDSFTLYPGTTIWVDFGDIFYDGNGSFSNQSTTSFKFLKSSSGSSLSNLYTSTGSAVTNPVAVGAYFNIGTYDDGPAPILIQPLHGRIYSFTYLGTCFMMNSPSTTIRTVYGVCENAAGTLNKGATAIDLINEEILPGTILYIYFKYDSMNATNQLAVTSSQKYATLSIGSTLNKPILVRDSWYNALHVMGTFTGNMTIGTGTYSSTGTATQKKSFWFGGNVCKFMYTGLAFELLDIESFNNDNANGIIRGGCSTAAGTAQKVVSNTGVGAISFRGPGTIISVYFTNRNSAANPTIKLGDSITSSTGGYIKYRNHNISSGLANCPWDAGSVVTLMYNPEDNWDIISIDRPTMEIEQYMMSYTSIIEVYPYVDNYSTYCLDLSYVNVGTPWISRPN